MSRRRIGLASAALFTLLLLFGCGANATDYSEGGAKAKATQLVKESVGDRYGPEVANTVNVDFTTVKEGASEGRMYLEGSTNFTWKHEGMKKTWDYTQSFSFELQHNGTDWTVRNKSFYSEDRIERK